MKTTIDVMTITPEIASEWLLDKWPDQRGVRKAHVDKLASDMSAGRFQLSPDAVLRVKGKLANGQHRLQAIVQSGKPQKFIVMESSDDDLFKVIDAGLKRTVADALIGSAFANQIPSIARWVRTYEAQSVNREWDSTCTQSVMVDYCRSNSETLIEAAAFVNPLYVETKLLPRSLGGAIYVIGSIHNKKEEAKRFLESIYLGTGETSAATDIRNRLISNRGSTARIGTEYIFGISLKSFKSFIEGKRMGVVRWSKDEKFPTICP